MAGLVTKDAHAPGFRAAFNLEHLPSLKLAQARVGKIKRDRDAWRIARGEPFIAQPAMGAKEKTAPFKLAVQPIDVLLQFGAGNAKVQIAEAHLQQKLVGQLSGGERNRLHLAKVLRSGGNVLLLDEPTNDLDVETLRALEDALENFAGCAVVISHDRFFLDRLATHILAFEGDSKVEWFEGNFEAYEDDKKRRLGADSLIPHRIKFQKFTRSIGVRPRLQCLRVLVALCGPVRPPRVAP